MQVTETLNEGLKRKLSVTIPATDLVSRLDAKLDELKGKATLKGFRPGKVPTAHLKKMYGRSAMSEVMQEAINATVADTLDKREERAAAQPKVDLPGDQGVINKVLDGEADLAFEVEYEVLPTVTLSSFEGLEITYPVASVSDEEVEREVRRVFLSNRGYADKGDDGVVEDGDRIGLAFVGKIDGEPFEGGTSDHAHVVIGSGDFIPGFEEQLIGVKKGGTKQVSVTFPADYTNAELANKAATFDVTVLHVDGPDAVEFDDEFATRLGMESVDKLREAVKSQMLAALDSMSRQHMKRQVLDLLDERHKFDVPAQLLEAEFEQIWRRVTHEIEQHGKSFEAEGTTEDEAREQYRAIAERRVRLGLVVAEIGNANGINVTEEEHQQALIAEVRRFPGQEQQVYDYYRQNPQALASLRAPVFENKVVSFVAGQVTQVEKPVTRAELVKLVQADDEGGLNGHDHDHDH